MRGAASLPQPSDSVKRVAAWKERANRAYAQWRHWRVVEIEMVVLVKIGRMTAAIQLYHGRLPHVQQTAV